MVMINIKIADLKAHLSEHLRRVRGGEVLTILDRTTPIAQVVPFEGPPATLRVRHPLRKSKRLQAVRLPPRIRLEYDIVDLLMEERQAER